MCISVYKRETKRDNIANNIRGNPTQGLGPSATLKSCSRVAISLWQTVEDAGGTYQETEEGSGNVAMLCLAHRGSDIITLQCSSATPVLYCKNDFFHRVFA